MLKLFVKTLTILAFCSIVPELDAEAYPYLRPRNNVNLNLFGDASIFSLNYERLFLDNRKFFLAGKAGIGYSQSLGLPVSTTSLLSIPLHITGNVNISGKRQFLEFGFGSTLMFYQDFTFWDYSIYPLIGYRWQPVKPGRVTFRIFVSYPLTDKIDKYNYWFSPVGMSIGFAF
jgi:hypothetical protein